MNTRKLGEEGINGLKLKHEYLTIMLNAPSGVTRTAGAYI